jgi:hypothetical protein
MLYLDFIWPTVVDLIFNFFFLNSDNIKPAVHLNNVFIYNYFKFGNLPGALSPCFTAHNCSGVRAGNQTGYEG